ncbi:MAG TPA: GNAT family N-acetyltransferase [Sphingopyxis sp.]|jgi:GNAT superfamily N-acetyltransferase|uniref:GNAT family N-acetyltransferase n=1 Tax=Sphingopyxis sp. TaxID=1908224 RepID=UPI002E14B29F|nr:GNAT family N-acetyltransferase [Sphingopyxis sp.]
MYAERIYDPADLEEIYALRVAAWRARVESFPDIGQWTDAHDTIAAHWAVRDRERIVAAARLSVHDSLAELPHAEIFDGVFSESLDGPIGSLNRLVVAASHSGRGCSAALDSIRINHARAQGCRHVIGETYAGTKRIAQLADLGFKVAGTARPYLSGPLAVVKGVRGATADDGHRMAAIIHMALDLTD